MAEKLDETRKFFTRHNVLTAKAKYLTNESALIQDLLSKFEGALKRDKKSAAGYIGAVEGALGALSARLEAERRMCSEKERTRGERAARVQELVNVGRKYARTVRELQEEVEKNDALRAQQGAQ
jgi:hypothetical protein